MRSKNLFRLHIVIQTTDEILRAIDKRKLTDLFLPDLSKAFDSTNNHEIHLDK